jgi:hypothetical protein
LITPIVILRHSIIGTLSMRCNMMDKVIIFDDLPLGMALVAEKRSLLVVIGPVFLPLFASPSS